MIIREMLKEDWPKVSAIYIQGIEGNKATFTTVCPTYEEWDEGHLQVGRLVAVKGDEVVGWVALSPTSSRYAYRGVAEVSLYIDNKYQGQGIGKLILNEVWEVAEEEGLWTLQSCIMANNEASLVLHERCGYRTVGYRERHGQDQYGTWRDTILVEKRSKNS